MKIKGSTEVTPVRRTPETQPIGTPDRQDRVSTEQVDQAVKSAKVAQSLAAGDRTAKLKQLEAQVRAGNYRPDPLQIAEELLRTAELTARLRALIP